MMPKRRSFAEIEPTTLPPAPLLLLSKTLRRALLAQLPEAPQRVLRRLVPKMLRPIPASADLGPPWATLRPKGPASAAPASARPTAAVSAAPTTSPRAMRPASALAAKRAARAAKREEGR